MDIILPLASTLSFEELSNLCAINTEYREMCESDQIWETLYLRDFGKIGDKPVVSWKFEYLLQKSQPKMALVNRDVGLIKMPLPYLPSADITQVTCRYPYLLVLEESGNLYFTNLEIKPIQFQKVEGTLFSSIGSRIFVGLSTEGKLCALLVTESNEIVIEPISAFAGEIITEFYEGWNGYIYAINNRKELFYLSSRRYPSRLEKIQVADVYFIYPFAQESVLLLTLAGSDRWRKAYIFTEGHLTLLTFNDQPLDSALIKQVRREEILLIDGRVLVFSHGTLIDWTKQWARIDPNWRYSIIKSISEDYILLENGEVWSIFNKFPLENFERWNLEELESARQYFFPDPLTFPNSGSEPELIVLMSGKGFFSKNGTFFIREYPDFLSGKFDYGFKPQHLLEVKPTSDYLFWKNFKITISSQLYRLLLEKGLITGSPDDNYVFYQGREIRIIQD